MAATAGLWQIFSCSLAKTEPRTAPRRSARLEPLDSGARPRLSGLRDDQAPIGPPVRASEAPLPALEQHAAFERDGAQDRDIG